MSGRRKLLAELMSELDRLGLRGVTRALRTLIAH